MTRPLALARMRKSMQKHLQGGWQRAVLASPQQDGTSEQRVFHGPSGPPSPNDLERAIDVAQAAARDGLVKHTYIIDERTRVRIDARYGKAKVQSVSDEALAKMMGGKDRPLRPDRSEALLRQIGIMNADGSISAKQAKKYKQVNHFVELCRPTWAKLARMRSIDEQAPLRLVDLGCGNSYLTFVMAESLRLEGIPAAILGIDRRSDVIERSRTRARDLGWDHLQFEVAAIEDIAQEMNGRIDLVVSLHACDTATDDALALAIDAGVPAVFSVPCCQHELAGQLERAPVPTMIKHGLFKQDYAALLTDAIRVEILEAVGYATDLVEFVGSEHSAKNRMIRAHRKRSSGKVELADVEARCRDLGIVPKLLKLLA